MDSEGLLTLCKDHNISATDQSNDPFSCNTEQKVSMKTDTRENNELELKETMHCNSVPNVELTSQSAFDHQLNKISIKSRVRLVIMFKNN